MQRQRPPNTTATATCKPTEAKYAKQLQSYKVDDLPSDPNEGAIAYATDGCKHGEDSGDGTGVPTYYSGGKWRVYRDDSEVAA